MIDPVMMMRFGTEIGQVAAAIITSANNRTMNGPQRQREARNEEIERKRMEGLWPLRELPRWTEASSANVEKTPLSVFVSVAGLSASSKGVELMREEATSSLFRMFCRPKPGSAPQPMFALGGWDPEKAVTDPSLDALDQGFPDPYLLLSAKVLDGEIELSVAYRAGGKRHRRIHFPVGERFALQQLVASRAKSFGGGILALVSKLDEEGKLSVEQKALIERSPMWKVALDNGRLDTIVDLLESVGLSRDLIGSEFFMRTARDDRDDSRVFAALVAALAAILTEADSIVRLDMAPSGLQPLDSVLSGLAPDAVDLFQKAQRETMAEAVSVVEALKRKKEAQDRAEREAAAVRAAAASTVEAARSNTVGSALESTGIVAAMVVSVLIPTPASMVVMGVGARRLAKKWGLM